MTKENKISGNNENSQEIQVILIFLAALISWRQQDSNL